MHAHYHNEETILRILDAAREAADKAIEFGYDFHGSGEALEILIANIEKEVGSIPDVLIYSMRATFLMRINELYNKTEAAA